MGKTSELPVLSPCVSNHCFTMPRPFVVACEFYDAVSDREDVAAQQEGLRALLSFFSDKHIYKTRDGTSVEASS